MSALKAAELGVDGLAAIFLAAALSAGPAVPKALTTLAANTAPPLNVGAGRPLSVADVFVREAPRVSNSWIVFCCVAAEDELLNLVSSLPLVMTGAAPVQKALNHAVLFASRPAVALPTVVGAFDVVDGALLSSDDDTEEVDDAEVADSLEPADCAALLVGASLEAAELAAELAGDSVEAAELAGAMLDDIDDIGLDITLDEVTAALELDDVADAVVPLVELHPASSTAAPVRAAIKVVRFIGAPSSLLPRPWSDRATC